MSDNAMARHGAFSWCALLTTDVQAATRFYTALLGWTTEEVPGMDYTVVKTGDVGIGGIMAIPTHALGAPLQWGTYVTVDDVDVTARKAQALGAKTVVPLTAIPHVGRLYPFQDPQGAVISIIPSRMEGAPREHVSGARSTRAPPRWDALAPSFVWRPWQRSHPCRGGEDDAGA